MKQPKGKDGHEKQTHHCRDGFTSPSPQRTASGDLSCVQALSALKGAALIDFALVPDGEDHAYPHICQGTNRHAVTFALSALALVIVSGPRLLIRRLPGELSPDVAQRLDPTKP